MSIFPEGGNFLRDYVKLTDRDNVAVATHDVKAGTEIMPGLTLLDDIPQAHKFALVDIPKDGEIIRYGVVLGYALGRVENVIEILDVKVYPEAGRKIPVHDHWSFCVHNDRPGQAAAYCLIDSFRVHACLLAQH